MLEIARTNSPPRRNEKEDGTIPRYPIVKINSIQSGCVIFEGNNLFIRWHLVHARFRLYGINTHGTDLFHLDC